MAVVDPADGGQVDGEHQADAGHQADGEHQPDAGQVDGEDQADGGLGPDGEHQVAADDATAGQLPVVDPAAFDQAHGVATAQIAADALERPGVLTEAIYRLAIFGPSGLRPRHWTADTAAELRSIIKGGAAAYAALWSEHGDAIRAYAQAHDLRPGDSRFYFAEGCSRRVAAQAAQQQQDRDRRARPVEASRDLARADRPRIHRTPAVYADAWRQAVHESGHACIGIAGGLLVSRCELGLDLHRDGGPSLGRVVLDPSPTGGSMYPMLIALMAGAAAERRLFGYHEPGTDHGDVELARQQLARCFEIDAADPEIDEWLEVARTDAAAEVADHWPWIERTATLLRRHRTISQAQIEACRDEPTAPLPERKDQP